MPSVISESPCLSDSPSADSQYARNHTCSLDSPSISLPHASEQFGRKVEVVFLCPAPLNDFEGVRTLQRRNLVSAVPVLISSKSFRCSALLEIKLITINNLEGWELSLHGTPYSSIFHIKFEWKFSFVKREDCWKGSNIKKNLSNTIILNLDEKVMRCSDSPEDSETFSLQIRVV